MFLNWQLPLDWEISPSPGLILKCMKHFDCKVKQTVIPGEFKNSYYYVPLDIRIADRGYHFTVNVPFQRAGSVVMQQSKLSDDDIHEQFQRYYKRISNV